jgi:phosphate starvation-inducible PhoH-like protein
MSQGNSQSRKQKRQERKVRREARRVNTRPNSNIVDVNFSHEKTQVFLRGKLHPKNEEQRSVLNAIDNSGITVIAGRVGSGKTFLAAAKGTEMLLDPNSKIERIVLVRPPETLGKDVGFLPGTKEEKMRPFLVPILDGIEYMVGKVGADRLMAQDKLEFVLVSHLRGRTWNNCFVIIDEANNLSQRATAVALLRKGMDTKVVFCGDIKQSDIKDSGMALFPRMMEEYENVPFMYREMDKNVRSEESSAFAMMFEEMEIEY